MKQIFPRYIHKLYYYLLSMSDDDLDDFHINDESCRARLFGEMKADFDTYGPVSKQRVLEAIEHILSSGRVDKLWGYVVPQEVLLDEIEDKPGYLHALYQRLAEHEPPQGYFDLDVELVKSAGPHGIDVRL